MTIRIARAAAAAAALLFAGTAQGQAGPQIEWRVKDRFRLFDHANVEAKARVALLADKLAAQPTRLLKDFYPDYLDALSGRDGARSHSASLRTSNYRPAGKEAPRSSGRYAPDYLFPEHYSVELRTGGAEGNCTYTSAIETRSGPCEAWTPLVVAEGVAVSRADWRVTTTVQVTAEAGQPVAVPIAFQDELVVALGDSYISGEGNPDVPSVITKRRDDIFERPSWGDKVKSGRDVLREAGWWDEPCHRSLLSWPVLASFAHAARDPHRAVTLVHLGCSGAIAKDLYQNGETDLPGGGDERESQLALLDTLRQRPSAAWGERKVSRVLLSIGGNDIGFVGVLIALSLPPNGYTFGPKIAREVGKTAEAICPYDDTGKPLNRLCVTQRSAQARLRDLPGEYDNLVAAFKKAMPDVPVYQTIYPNPLLGLQNKPCDTNLQNGPLDWMGEPSRFSGFESLMGILPRYARGFRPHWAFELRYDPETIDGPEGKLFPTLPVGCDWTPEPGDSEVCGAMWVLANLNRVIKEHAAKWAVIEAHAHKIQAHGLCRHSDAFPLGVPLIKGRGWVNGRTPQSVDPYAEDNPRWFRTPNDSIVTQFGFHDGEPRFHHGTVHPTFRAHIEFAQAAYDSAFRSEGSAALP